MYESEGLQMAIKRLDRDGSHRKQFERNKKKIYATQTVCGICGKPVDFSYKYPHPLSPCIDHIIPVAKEDIQVTLIIFNWHTGHATDKRVTNYFQAVGCTRRR